jgi:uncharacterized protein (DUF362 family)
MHPPAPVLLYACADYDPDRIARLVGLAMDRLGVVPRGRTLVKPNCVASGPFFPHAHTRAEVVEGVLRALQARRAPGATLALGERSGITMPTRYAFRGAGYLPVLERLGVEPAYFDEHTQVPVALTHAGRLRDRVYVPSPVAAADTFVSVPKFKAHPWTTVTFSMKGYIGLQDDRHRLIDHDHSLDRKVADLQAVIQPQLVVVDAITAGEGRMLTPLPFPLGLLVVGACQMSVDAVCCRILGLDPMEVTHLRLAWERGYGPRDLGAIPIEGDVSLAEAQERARGFRVGRVPVDQYFAGTQIRAYAGQPPTGPGGEAHCWGGCPGALMEAVELLRLFDQATDRKMPPLHIVFGRWDGPIPAAPGEKVVFLGDCAAFDGELGGQAVRVESAYAPHAADAPEHARHDDIYVKMGRVSWDLWRARHAPVLRLRGCPVSVAEQVLTLVQLGGLKNPYFEPRQAVGFTSAYLSWRTRTALQRLMGQPYQAPAALARA